mmetsp:Transcript_32454/g.64339  ORF Transcript_32454/g.64339 Transcript_32454/m.64339 type:complete len:730 (+) Transcript_32454:87-2276(+)|eukprot:CAMPEP_0194313710 /NCGR_PEP_ID=MMETSP0171-20130528/10567_1 /TAXON_ID=218684 /ORGANISM="Corethron pennatum, Strain L29A3" /LENGTH=729 /DNA_ID=CAMNT_0039068785 /DNA_START=82 /DNA_END=2271 /DNA_ORIENTATION=+
MAFLSLFNLRSLFLFAISAPSTVLAAHLTYFLPDPPLIAERESFSHLVLYTGEILTSLFLDYDESFNSVEKNFNDGSAVPSCLDDRSLCSLTTSKFKITLISGGANASSQNHHATLDISVSIDGETTKSVLNDFITRHLHKYLYGGAEKDSQGTKDPQGGLREKILLDLDQLPIFSVVSDTAKDDDLSTFLSVLSPKNLLEKSDTDQIWTDDRDIRRAYHYGRLILTCKFQRDTQSCIPSDSDVIRAEAFVHPALNSHPLPSRILFIGPYPCLAIQEALKYESVNEIVVLGYDEVQASMAETFMGCKYPPGMLDKITFESVTPADYLRKTAKQIKRFVKGKTEEELEEGAEFLYANQFDVIFFHVPDIDHDGQINGIYKKWTSDDFQYDLRMALLDYEDDSLVVVNMGSGPGLDGKDRNSMEAKRSKMLRHLFKEEIFDYTPISMYDEPRAAPYDTSFFVLFYGFPVWNKSHENFIRQNAGAITLSLASKMSSTDMSNLPTKFYDGTTHKSYQRPSRAWEEWSCLSPAFNGHDMCTTYRPQLYDKTGNFNNSTVVALDDIKGRTLKATEAIPAGKFINLQDPATSLYLDLSEWRLLNDFIEKYPDASMYAELRDYIDEYGYESFSSSRVGWVVSTASVSTFINHGCTKEEFKVRAVVKREDPDVISHSYFFARHTELLNNGLLVLKDIGKDEEILQDYREFWDAAASSEFDDFENEVCGNRIGLIQENI